MSGSSSTLETSVGLEEEIESKWVSNGGVHYGSSWEIAGTVEISLVKTEEPHVVPLGAHNEGYLLISGEPSPGDILNIP